MLEFVDDDDDILLALAEELGGLIEHVGGPPHAHVLLGPLETLWSAHPSCHANHVISHVRIIYWVSCVSVSVSVSVSVNGLLIVNDDGDIMW